MATDMGDMNLVTRLVAVIPDLGIRRRLIAEDQLVPAAGATPLFRLASGRRPDNRFPHGSITRPQYQGTEGTQDNEVKIHVVAQVNLRRKDGKMGFVNPLQHGVGSEPGSDESVVIRARGSDGQVLLDHPVDVQINFELLRTTPFF